MIDSSEDLRLHFKERELLSNDDPKEIQDGEKTSNVSDEVEDLIGFSLDHLVLGVELELVVK